MLRTGEEWPWGELTPTVAVDESNSIWVGDERVSDRDRLKTLLLQLRQRDGTGLHLIVHPESTHEMRILVADVAAEAGFLRMHTSIREISW